MLSGDYMSPKDDTDDILHVLERMCSAGVCSISKSKLNSTCGKIADYAVFKGMEQILVRKLLGMGHDVGNGKYGFLVTRVVQRGVGSCVRGYDGEILKHYEYRNCSYGTWNSHYSWVSGVGLWSGMVRRNYIESMSRWGIDDFCMDPRVISDVLVERRPYYRTDFYLLWGIADA